MDDKPKCHVCGKEMEFVGYVWIMGIKYAKHGCEECDTYATEMV